MIIVNLNLIVAMPYTNLWVSGIGKKRMCFTSGWAILLPVDELFCHSRLFRCPSTEAELVLHKKHTSLQLGCLELIFLILFEPNASCGTIHCLF